MIGVNIIWLNVLEKFVKEIEWGKWEWMIVEIDYCLIEIEWMKGNYCFY